MGNVRVMRLMSAGVLMLTSSGPVAETTTDRLGNQLQVPKEVEILRPEKSPGQRDFQSERLISSAIRRGGNSPANASTFVNSPGTTVRDCRSMPR